MATRRDENDPYSSAGTPSNWMNQPTVGSSTQPRIDDNGGGYVPPTNGSEWMGNGGVAGTTNTPRITPSPYTPAAPSQNIGPWASGIGPQPPNVTVPGQNAAAGQGSGGAGGFGGITGDWTRPTLDMIKAYGRSRGVELNDQQAGYWVSQWSNLMRETPNDPSYATMRLSLADEWTPANQRYMAGSGAGSGGNEFNDRWGSNLENLVASFLNSSRERAASLAGTYRTRAKELRDTPAYSAQDEAAIQARAYDQLERRRQETLKNQREQVYARGFAPTSGLVADRENQVNTGFEQARTGIASDILRAQLDETNRRKDAALQLEALATEALNGGDLGAIQATGLPLTLMNTRQNNALAAVNSSSGGNIGQLLSLILGAAGNNQQNNQQNAANTAAGYGNLASILTALFGGR